MSSRNAELLYSYGRCLYHVAVKNSDVLGSKVAGEKREDGPMNAKAEKAQKTATASYCVKIALRSTNADVLIAEEWNHRYR